jgi:hypothetical protein
MPFTIRLEPRQLDVPRAPSARILMIEADGAGVKAPSGIRVIDGEGAYSPLSDKVSVSKLHPAISSVKGLSMVIP